jgi:hypothetical protein
MHPVGHVGDFNPLSNLLVGIRKIGVITVIDMFLLEGNMSMPFFA